MVLELVKKWAPPILGLVAGIAVERASSLTQRIGDLLKRIPGVANLDTGGFSGSRLIGSAIVAGIGVAVMGMGGEGVMGIVTKFFAWFFIGAGLYGVLASVAVAVV